MPLIAFESLPDHARLWVFAASRPLEETEAEHLLSAVDAFLGEWNAHRVPLVTVRHWAYGRFLFVAVYENATGVSGCSVDALVRRLRDIELELDVVLTDHAPVLYRDGDGIRRIGRQDFRELARRGEVGPATTVFDNTIRTVAALRSGAWEVPARASWHSALLGGGASGAGAPA